MCTDFLMICQFLGNSVWYMIAFLNSSSMVWFLEHNLYDVLMIVGNCYVFMIFVEIVLPVNSSPLSPP